MSDVAKCPMCQKYIDITFNSETCPQCGGNIANYNLQPEVHSQYNGVGGWLLLLCVGMTILGPLFNFFYITQEIAASNKISAYYPEVETAVKIEVAFTIFLIVCSMYAGISLWTKRPNAVFKAKIYLLLLPVITILSIFITYSMMPPVIQNALLKESTVPLIRTVLYSVIWFIYLSSSQRVAETYAEV